ncbi:Ribonuclease HII [Hondaea fermentalgiana]|uniref:Ribonuclease n=1 Tax=Hondaea fermentalgiana TaxID=2315210 RepID=A0A2R5G274_9STRA|nr:Ribonuclease HII [Hondaea fermentalgiana]|eukprot:GBG25127.1 Ribonuclease HII [Hondaea fermentalgiana]
MLRFQARRVGRVRGYLVLRSDSAKEATAKKAKALGPSKDRENGLRKLEGFKVVAGADEAGRGPLAGPVVAAACVVPEHVTFEGVEDSKRVSETDRERLYHEITSHPEVSYGISQASPAEIDEYNILQASLRAMSRAVAALSPSADFVLIDGPHLPKDLPASVQGKEAVIKGDSKIYAIACASILAKVTRDRIMVELDKTYPIYGFAKHKGYPTAAHRAAVATHGPSEVHRQSFAPVRLAAEAARLRAEKATQALAEEDPEVAQEKEKQGKEKEHKEISTAPTRKLRAKRTKRQHQAS